jgi:lipopolysaccharide export system permease protein
MIIRQPSEDEPGQTIEAAWAELRAFPAEGRLLARVHQFTLQMGDARFETPGTEELSLTFDTFGRGSRSRSPSNYALAEIKPAIREHRKRLDQIEQAQTAQAAFAMLMGNFESLSPEAWQPLARSAASTQTQLHKFYTEPWRRWANGFSCLCFVLVGAPVAIRLRFSEFIASFFLCFLPILFVYYPLMAVSLKQAKNGAIPPQTIWLGNIVLALVGAWLLRKVIRY